MYLTKEVKKEQFKTYGFHKKEEDTGSPESQIALFTYRISELTNHLKTNKKDNSTRLGLTKLVGKRRKLLNYLKDNDITRYRNVLESLNLRK